MSDDMVYFGFLGWTIAIMLLVAVLMCVSGRSSDGLRIATLMAGAVIAFALVMSHMFPDAAMEAVTPSLGLVPNAMAVGI